MAQYSGTTFNIGGRELVVPALSMKQLRLGGIETIRKHDELIGEGKYFDAVTERVKVIGMALRRNYPEITDEQLEDELDLNNTVQVWLAVLGSSGLQNTNGADTGDAPGPLATMSGQSTEALPEPTAGA